MKNKGSTSETGAAKTAGHPKGTSETSALQWEVFVTPGIPVVTPDRPEGVQETYFQAMASTLIYGAREAVLVDAFMTTEQSTALANWVASKNRELTTIYITHGHGDHWFGVGAILARFPDAKVVATPDTVRVMRQNASPEALRGAWEPAFPRQIPDNLVVAKELDSDVIDLEGHELRVVELGHTDTDHTTCLYVPSLGLVVAGDAAYNDVHLYLAESDAQKRREWIAALDKIESLHPRAVVATHKRPENDDSPRIIAETRQYIQDFDRLADTTTTAQELYDKMLQLHPRRVNPGWALWSSARAVKGLERPMSSITTASNTSAPTQTLRLGGHSYAYRRFGHGAGAPLLLLQHFTGTLDNWDPAVTDALAARREVILFDNAGVGRSSGEVPPTVAGMARHAMAFLEGLGVATCDVLGYSLGGMVALQMAQDRPAIFRKMILVGTAPRGGEDIMHLEKPGLAKRIQDPANRGYDVLQKIFFTGSPASQAAGAAFIRRLEQRKEDRDPPAGPSVGNAQIAAFREWEKFTGERFADLKTIGHPTLVVNGVNDEMIPVSNSYRLGENLPNAVLLTYPDAGHGSLFQYPESFTRHAEAFLASESASAAF